MQWLIPKWWNLPEVFFQLRTNTQHSYSDCLCNPQIIIPLPHFWWEILIRGYKVKAVSTKCCHFSDFKYRVILTPEVIQPHSAWTMYNCLTFIKEKFWDTDPNCTGLKSFIHISVHSPDFSGFIIQKYLFYILIMLPSYLKVSSYSIMGNIRGLPITSKEQKLGSLGNKTLIFLSFLSPGYRFQWETPQPKWFPLLTPVSGLEPHFLSQKPHE